MHDLYDGAAHLRSVGVPQISPLGERAARLLAIWLYGLHHLPRLDEIDWADPHCIELRWSCELSTYDNNMLTHLVVLAHQHALRLEISPRSREYLTLRFHGRAHDAAAMHKRHPTIQQALSRWLHPKGFGGETMVIAVVLDLDQREALAEETEVMQRALAAAGCPAAEPWTPARQLIQRVVGNDLLAERLRRIGAVLSEGYGDHLDLGQPLALALDLLPPATGDERAALARLVRAEQGLINAARLCTQRYDDAELLELVEELDAAMEGSRGR